MTAREFSDEQIESAIGEALAEQNVNVIPGLIAVLALQNPERAEHIRQTILLGLNVAMSAPPRILTVEQVAIVLDNNRSGKAPGCIGCGHLLVFHGAGRCAAPGEGCKCPSTTELWDASLAPEPPAGGGS
jgi:hypothetical protein